MKKFKKVLKRLPKKAIALIMVFSMLINTFFPVMTVSATVSGDVTINIDGPWDIEGVLVDADRNGTVTIDANDVITFTNFDSSKMKAYIEASDGFNANLIVDENGKTSIANAECNGLPNTTLNLKVAPLNGGGNSPTNYPDDIAINATFNNASGEIIVNGTRVTGDNGEVTSYNDTKEKVGYIDSSKKNEITIRTAFGENVAGEITINGVSYDTNGTDSNTFEIAGASSYTIVVLGDSSIVTPKTIIWTNPDYNPVDAEDAAWTSQFNIGHGYARAIEVYDENGNKLKPSEYINPTEQPDGSKSDEYGLRNGFGWIEIMPGYKVVFEFVPEYGYQLTGITINEQPIAASSQTNRFEFIMPNASGNIHFGATFTKTEDIVKADSTKVSSGTIDLNNELSGGSAQLTVSDVTLNASKIAGFENAAGDYEISNYLDIDLYNVFYKGKNDANDVWSNKISELDNEATISIKLEDGISADDIIIVHNVHDGDEYEIIEIDSYDKTTNTITFKTKSFSNYAIATKSNNIKITTTNNTSEDKNAKEEVTKIIKKIVNGETVKGVTETLKAAILDAVNSGKTINVDVKTDSVKESDVSDDAAKIKSLIGSDSKVAGYYDITVGLSIEGTYKGNITLLDNEVAIILNLPSDIPSVASDYNRTYTVVRVHDGVAEKLDTTLNNDGTITFKTDKFSTYAITYTDSKVTSNPKTYDNIILYYVTLILSVSGLIGASLILNKRRKLNN